MAINSVTDLRNTDPGQTAFTVRQNPVGGTTPCHAMQVTQAAHSGSGAGINVVSDNPDSPAYRAKAAGPLLQLYSANNVLQFEVDNDGTVTTGSFPITGDLSVASLTTSAGVEVGTTLEVTGTTTLTGGIQGSTTLRNGNFTIDGTTKSYRFRQDGGGLDLEASGADLVVSNWSGAGFTGTQRSYLRLSSDALNTQMAGNVEFVDALYGNTGHTINGVTGVAALGAKNSLTNVRICGARASVGAPTTGTWATGDAIMDSAGTWWLCTTGGTPGTWVPGTSTLNLPSEQNLLAWTYDPDMAGHVTAQSNAGVAGRITLTRIILRNTFTWSNIWIGLSGVDAAATLSNCYLGVYSSAGTLLGATADISTSLMSGAVAKPLALSTPFTATPGTYFIAMLLNGTWTTNSLTFKASGAGSSVNAGLTAPNLRYSNMLTGQTSLPSTLDLSGQTSTIITTGWASQWYGVS